MSFNKAKDAPEVNGYQGALDTIVKFCLSVPANGQGEGMGFTEDFDFDHDACETECSLLQELVDKETPMKPFKNNIAHQLVINRCESCDKMLFGKFRYCQCCGQKIDWSNE